MKSTKRSKKKPPARARYEASHPTISVRVPQAVYDHYKEVLGTSRLSGSAWFKARLAEDEAAAASIARALAKERDGLGRQVEALKRERQQTSQELEERRRQLAASAQEEKEKLLEEAKAEVEREASRLRRTYEQELGDLQNEIAEADDALSARRIAVIKLDLQIRNRDGTIRQLAEEAMQRLRAQGIPYMACATCPGRAMIMGFLQALPVARQQKALSVTTPDPSCGQAGQVPGKDPMQ